MYIIFYHVNYVYFFYNNKIVTKHYNHNYRDARGFITLFFNSNH